MSRLGRGGAAGALMLIASIGAACGSSGNTTAATGGSGGSTAASTSANKAGFCADLVKIDKAGMNATSAQSFLQILQANQSVLADMAKHLPGGSLGAEAQQVLNAANTAINTNNTGALNSPSLSHSGGDLDTYCGVDVNGAPLPNYFGQGKASAFCVADTQISQGTSTATDPSSILAFLSSHQSLVNQFGANISGLPTSIKSEAQSLFSAAQSAISSNNASALGAPAVSTDANDVDLYCGINH